VSVDDIQPENASEAETTCVVENPRACMSMTLDAQSGDVEGMDHAGGYEVEE
jgi:hypothetical protein